MARTIIQVDTGEWSEWNWNEENIQRIGCCDCGLVHDFEFRAVSRNGDTFVPIKNRFAKVLWRVRSNKDATDDLRHKRSAAMRAAKEELK